MADMFIQQDPGLERKRRLAMQMMQQPTPEIVHWTQGLADVFQKGLGAYMAKQADTEGAERKGAYEKTIQQAITAQPWLDPDTKKPFNSKIEEMVRVLASNPDTANIAMQLKLQDAAKEPKERKILTDVGGFKRYQDSGERVFPDVEKPENLPWYAKRGEEGKLSVDPGYLEMQKEIGESRKPETTVNLPTLEKEEEKGVGKFYAESFGEYQKGAKLARSNNARLSRVKSLLGKVETGALAPTKLNVQKIAKSLGIDIDVEGLGAAEALRSITNDLAMDAIAKTKGAVSEKEMAFFVEIAPQLSKTVEGNKKIIDAIQKLNDREIKIASMARQHRKKYGSLGALDDKGNDFEDTVDEYVNANPLFSESDLQQGSIASPKTEEEYNALPSGAEYIDPDDGKRYRKP